MRAVSPNRPVMIDGLKTAPPRPQTRELTWNPVFEEVKRLLHAKSVPGKVDENRLAGGRSPGGQGRRLL
jgi:hypothetical protein